MKTLNKNEQQQQEQQVQQNHKHLSYKKPKSLECIKGSTNEE